jgi:membrane fusion protein, multidrug efflux system
MNSNADADNSLPLKTTTNVSKPSKKRNFSLIVVGVLLAAVAIWLVLGRSGKVATGNDPQGTAKVSNPALQKVMPVVISPVREEKLDLSLSALGTVTPLNAVVVRGRVEGQLTAVLFEEGQTVKQGELLAQIDPRPFEVQVTLASGQLARDQALLEKAQTDLERYQTLLQQESISGQLVDNQASLVRQYKAAVQGSQGNLDNAKLQLSYTQVTSPISGRVGLRQVTPGNVVRLSDSNGIAAITQLQPVAVVFSIPEDSLPKVMKLLKGGERVAVDAYDRGQKEKLGKGRLLAADNQIDPSTGTIKLKAEFPNADNALFANQFVNVKMAVETKAKATVLPSAAVLRGSVGNFVYVVKADQTVTVRPIKVSTVQGELTAIEQGVTVGENVVIEGADGLREGTKVKVNETLLSPKKTQPENPSEKTSGDAKRVERPAA